MRGCLVPTVCTSEILWRPANIPSGQPHVRHVDADLNSSALAEDPLHAEADVETTTAELLQADAGTDVGGDACRPGPTHDAPRVPREPWREKCQHAHARKE